MAKDLFCLRGLRGQQKANVLVLMSDMSDVINNDQAKQIFERWAGDI